MDSDLAIVEMSEPIEFSGTIYPIAMPTEPVNGGEQMVVTGWGESEDTMDENILNEAQVPIIERDICNQQDWYNGKISQNMICAG